MAKFRKTQTNFISGIIGPELRGRTDVGEYNNGALDIENFLGNEQGTLLSRNGTNYVSFDETSFSEIIKDCNKQVYFFDIDDSEWVGFIGLATGRHMRETQIFPSDTTGGIPIRLCGAINTITGETNTNSFILSWESANHELIYSPYPEYYSWNVTADLGDTKFLHTRWGNSFIITHTSGAYAPIYLRWDPANKQLIGFPMGTQTTRLYTELSLPGGNLIHNYRLGNLGAGLPAAPFMCPFEPTNTDSSTQVLFWDVPSVINGAFNVEYKIEIQDGEDSSLLSIANTIFDPVANAGRLIRFAFPSLNPDATKGYLFAYVKTWAEIENTSTTHGFKNIDFDNNRFITMYQPEVTTPDPIAEDWTKYCGSDLQTVMVDGWAIFFTPQDGITLGLIPNKIYYLRNPEKVAAHNSGGIISPTELNSFQISETRDGPIIDLSNNMTNFNDTYLLEEGQYDENGVTNDVLTGTIGWHFMLNGDPTINSNEQYFNNVVIECPINLSFTDADTWYNLVSNPGNILSPTQDLTSNVSNTSNYIVEINTKTTNFAPASWGGAAGYPRISTGIANRIVFANSPSRPMSLWFSLAGNIFYFNNYRFSFDYTPRFGVPKFWAGDPDKIVDFDPHAYDLTDELSTEIRWLYPSTKLEFGTDIGEYTVSSFSQNSIAETVKYESSYGAVFQNPVKVGNATIFILKDGKTLGRILFDFQRAGNSVLNINILAPNILNDFREASDDIDFPLIQKIAWDYERRILWVLSTTGEVYTVSTSFNVEGFGWQRQTFRGKARDILLSKSTVGNLTQVNPIFVFQDSLEILSPRNELPKSLQNNDLIYTKNENIYNFHFLDSAQTLNDFTGATSTWTFDNPGFENEILHVFADNQYLGERQLVGFDLTLEPNNLRVGSPNYVTVTAGFSYRRRLVKHLETSGSNTESGHEAYKRIDKVEVKFYRSSYAKIGSKNSILREIPFPLSPSDPLDFSDYNYIDAFSGNSEPEHQVVVESELPLPLNILTITTRGVLAD